MRTIIKVGHRSVETGPILDAGAAEGDVVRGIALDEGLGLAEFDDLVVRLRPPLVVAPLGGVVLHQDAPVILDMERDLIKIVARLVHPDGVVLVDEPLDRSVGIAALGRTRRLRNGQLGLGGIRNVELEMQQSVIADISAGNRIPGAHTAGRGFSRLAGEYIVIVVLAGRIGDRGPEPAVVLAAVVEHEIEVNADILRLGLVNQIFQVRFGAKFTADGIVVVYVVSVVRHRFVDRREPQGCGADAVEVVEVIGDTADVAPAVAVAVGETVDIQLIGDARKFLLGSLLPPGIVRRGVVVRYDRIGARGEQQHGAQQCENLGKSFHHNSQRYKKKIIFVCYA